MRLFKVLRMKRVELLEEIFETGERHREQENHEAKAVHKETEVSAKSGQRTEERGSYGLLAEKAGGRGYSGSAAEETGGRGYGGSVTEEIGGQGYGNPIVEEIVFRINRKEAYRIYDKFEENEITVLPGGDFEIRIFYPVDDWVYGMILSFGPSAKVLEPEWLKKELKERIRQMAQEYGI